MLFIFKSPSVTQRLVYQENAFKKSKIFYEICFPNDWSGCAKQQMMHPLQIKQIDMGCINFVLAKPCDHVINVQG